MEQQLEKSEGQSIGFDKTKLILPGAIILAALMVSSAVLYGRVGSGTALVKNTVPIFGQNLGPVQKVAVDISNSPMLGDAKAKVTVVEFGDFQCPFCQKYFQNNQSAIVSEYVNAGKVKFVWKDYAFLGQESMWAAEAARCANDQNKFWAYHDYIYSHQGRENSGAFSKSKLEGFANVLGLNTTQFNSCLNSDKYLSAVQKDTQYGSSVGVSGTPATFVNGILISGAVPHSQIKAAIDAELKK